MYMGLMKVTAAELERAFEDPGWAEELTEREERLEAEPNGDLEKAWAGIEYLLDKAGYGLELDMEGGRIHHEDMRFLDGWDPELVREVDRRLRELPWERLAEHYDAEAMLEADIYPGIWDDGGDRYLEGYYEGMREFFKDAAASGAGAIVSFG